MSTMIQITVLRRPIGCTIRRLQRCFGTMTRLNQRKIAIVTGSSNGIGQGIAIELSKRGYALTLCGRNTADLDATKKDCLQNGLQESDVRGDLSDPEECVRVASLTTEKFGRINALVNNAGGGFIPDSLEATTPESFDSIFSVNLRAPVLLTKACMPQLIENKGVIVNISSVVSVMPNFGVLLYRLTKAALDQFTTSIACDYGPRGVRVYGVLPGNIQTTAQEKGFRPLGEGWEAAMKAYTEGVVAAQVIKRTGTIKDVSDVVAFLLSDEASFITGVNLVVDGGLQLHSKGEGGFVTQSDD